MTQELPTLGDLELHVLQLVWQHEPCMERQISDLVQKERPVARTTVLKTMQRLEAKGLLVRVEGEAPIRYRAAVAQAEAAARADRPVRGTRAGRIGRAAGGLFRQLPKTLGQGSGGPEGDRQENPRTVGWHKRACEHGR